jgi:hypothetical protein
MIITFGLGWFGNFKGPTKEFCLKCKASKLVLFSSNHDGNIPLKLLLERSRVLKSY